MVLEFEWIDHHSPPLKLLFIICEKIQKFFEKDNENVVVINYREEKRRKETRISYYLIFWGKYEKKDDIY